MLPNRHYTDYTVSKSSTYSTNLNPNSSHVDAK